MSRRAVAYSIIFSVLLLASAQIYLLAVSPHESRVLSATTNLTVEGRLASLERRMSAVEKYSGMVKTKANSAVKENFMAISGGSSSGSSWTKIEGSDFSLDQSLYGSVTEVSWQGWMDNGSGYARIYDGTNHRAVDGSEIYISSGQKASFYSKALSIWRGQNQYWIEIKSVDGPVTISEPRLKINTK